jgi:DNA-binding NarL/FixJ family response regulator
MSGPARWPLTRRQTEVLAAAADGATLSVVAQRLGIPRERAAARLSEAYKRLDVAWMDRSERRSTAVRIARERGLIPAETDREAA